MYSDAVKAEAMAWFHTPKNERSPRTMTELAKKLGIKHVKTLHRMKDKLDDNGAEEYDPDTYLADSAKVVDAALIKACERGSPGALKAYYQITNRLVEKSENINIDISGDELTRRNLEAERRLRDMGYGVEDVQEKPPLLPEDVLSSPGQGTQGDNQV